MAALLENAKYQIKKRPEIRCDGCHTVTDKPDYWIWFNFKTLSPVWVCPDCAVSGMGEHCRTVQEMGL